MVAELLAEGKTAEQVIEILVREFRVPRNRAEFLVALETGEITGDVIITRE